MFNTATMSYESFATLKPGSIVRIVNNPTPEARCGWGSLMNDYLGKKAVVKAVLNSDNPSTHLVKLDIDNGNFSWTEKMFMPLAEEVKNPNFVRDIQKVIYNNPATIIVWADGTKTTAKAAEGEVYDPEKGLFLCALKHYVKSDAIISTLLPFVTEQALTKKSCVTVTYKDALNSISKSTRSAKKASKVDKTSTKNI